MTSDKCYRNEEQLSGLAANLARDPQTFSGPWNFGPEAESVVTVEDVVKRLLVRFPEGRWVDASDKNQPHEAKLLNLDCSKAHQMLKWKPSLGIAQSVALTVDWYRTFAQRNAYELCSEQIGRYTDEAKRAGNRWAVQDEG